MENSIYLKKLKYCLWLGITVIVLFTLLFIFQKTVQHISFVQALTSTNVR